MSDIKNSKSFLNSQIETFLSANNFLSITGDYALEQFGSYIADLVLLTSGVGYKDLGISARREKSKSNLYGIDAISGQMILTQDGGIRGKITEDFNGYRVAVINLRGVMRLEGTLSSRGVEDVIDDLEYSFNNDDIAAVVLQMESGGGEARAADILVGVLQTANKPVLTYVNRMAASAAYQAAAATHEIILSSEYALVGGIGTFISFDKKAIEKYRETVLEIYSDKSSGKNYEFRELIQGNLEPMKQLIEEMTDDFHSFIKKTRDLKGDKSEIADTLSGKVFKGKAATSKGLADGIGNLTYLGKRLKFHIKNYK